MMIEEIQEILAFPDSWEFFLGLSVADYIWRYYFCRHLAGHDGKPILSMESDC